MHIKYLMPLEPPSRDEYCDGHHYIRDFIDINLRKQILYTNFISYLNNFCLIYSHDLKILYVLHIFLKYLY